MQEWLKRDAGQLISGMIQTLVFVSVGTWYVGGRLSDIDRRDALHDRDIANLQSRIDGVESNAALFRSEVLAEVRGVRNDLRDDIRRLDDKLETKFNGRVTAPP